MEAPLVCTALGLARRGRAVFPCLPRDKRPATPRGFKDATTDPDKVREWWRHEPNFNVGVATGAVSGLFVVDIDGLDAEAHLRKLETELGKLPSTVEVITARGRHVYFRMPGCPVPNTAGKIAAGIDVRGDGGYVLAPHSIHPSGRAYAWSVDTGDTIATAPDWLLAKVTRRRDSSHSLMAPPPSDWRALFVNGVERGQRDVTVTRLCGHLLRHYVDPFVTLEILQLWNQAHCRPPLPPHDIERIVASIAGKELHRRYGRGEHR
jgi:hypothetical protein